MPKSTSATIASEVKALTKTLSPDMTKIYTDLHAHPELSMQEVFTAAKMAEHLQYSGYKVSTGIGKTGVVGVLQNGNGPVVMLRADMDALPIKEESGLPYASEVITKDRNGKSVPAMHACGHDIHMTSLIGAAILLSRVRSLWKGTLLIVFQPAEETSEGARAMIDDGLFDRFPKPDVILGQHVINTPLGSINCVPGVTSTTGDSLQIKLIGRSSHGAMPENSIDPVVMAALVVLRLQTIVSREIPANESVVLTIGSIQSGNMENVIPEEAVLKVNVRTFNEKVRQQVLEAIERIVKAEAAASGAVVPPEITTINHFSIVDNNAKAAGKVIEAFRNYFPAENIRETNPNRMSDDFGEFSLGYTIPSVYWLIGSTNPEIYEEFRIANRIADLPTNHNSRFAPVIPATLENGLQALVVAALAWLSV